MDDFGLAAAELVDQVRLVIHTMSMKRTNLVLDERVLEEATRLSGQKTYSKTVAFALEDFVRRFKARQILSLRGSGAWAGNLSAMRNDGKVRGRRPSRIARP